MDGLKSLEHLSGEPGKTGAVSRLKFQMGKRALDMTATVVSNTLPEAKVVRYDCDGAVNDVHHRFIAVSERATRWKMDNTFEFGSFLLQGIGLLLLGMFKKPTITQAQNFKAYAEHGASVLDKA